MYQEPHGAEAAIAPPDRRARERRPFRQQRRPEERVRILGETVDLMRPEEVLLHVERCIEAGRRSIIANHNLHSLYLLPRTPGMRPITRPMP